MKRKKAAFIAVLCLGIPAACVVLLLALVCGTTYHPREIQPEPVVCRTDAPVLQRGQKLKVLSWNIQYMAGKNYVFFYDLPDGSGPDERPLKEDIAATLKEVARVIMDESPDIVLLQEVDDGARRTDYQDQLALLLDLLHGRYPCHTSAIYWKAFFVPHPRIMGAVGMKLAILSKFKVAGATRHQLPQMPAGLLTRPFNLKRAVLEARLPVRDAKDFIVLDTHLDAFAQGTDTMERQVARVRDLLGKLSKEGFAWIIGGDFNLLPPGKAYGLLDGKQRAYFEERSEIGPLMESYPSVPDPGETGGEDFARWFTHFPNDPSVGRPDRTIDYIFFQEGMRLGTHYVRQRDTLEISDHLPVVAEFEIPL
jgi:endonuclease/exonuclease/phosphatase family metal-dependent hydrolase